MLFPHVPLFGIPQSGISNGGIFGGNPYDILTLSDLLAKGGRVTQRGILRPLTNNPFGG